LAGGKPEEIKNVAQRYISEATSKRDELYTDIERAKLHKELTHDESEDLKSRVTDAHDQTVSVIKESNNTGIDVIDDTSDTEDLLLVFPVFIVVSEVPLLRILYVTYTLYSLSLFSKFYNHILYCLYK
jgi:hypothetical protein